MDAVNRVCDRCDELVRVIDTGERVLCRDCTKDVEREQAEARTQEQSVPIRPTAEDECLKVGDRVKCLCKNVMCSRIAGTVTEVKKEWIYVTWDREMVFMYHKTIGLLSSSKKTEEEEPHGTNTVDSISINGDVIRANAATDEPIVLTKSGTIKPSNNPHLGCSVIYTDTNDKDHAATISLLNEKNPMCPSLHVMYMKPDYFEPILRKKEVFYSREKKADSWRYQGE